MQTRADLVDRSLEIIKTEQSASGAFIASPRFPVYQYCWFRDSTFIAQALDLWGEHERAQRFYAWGVDTILANAADAHAAIAEQPTRSPGRYLHTRYAADGTIGKDDWPNFQLDGFGTFLWGLVEHLRITEAGSVDASWMETVGLLVSYLTKLWRVPGFDCWEEFPGALHTSTLSAVYGGLHAVGQYFEYAGASRTASTIRSFIIHHVTDGGYLPKYVGARTVDASLLWASVPFSVLDVDHPVMNRTVAKIGAELFDPEGGVYRYKADSYYGGGQWILLAALFGETILRQGNRAGATKVMRWIEEQASVEGDLPEQVPQRLNFPTMYESWVDRWGPIASPLLWSHAAYLRLKYVLSDRG